jgi:hypothetical protein
MQMLWDPTNFAVDGLAPTSRTFELGYLNGLGNFVGSNVTDANTYFIDGFEVFGNVSVSYNVPEPAALSLIGVGAVLLLRRRTRRC